MTGDPPAPPRSADEVEERVGGSAWKYVIEGEQIYCVRGGKSQFPASFVEVERLTSHHDEGLAELTAQLNATMEGHHATATRDDDMHVAIIMTPDGCMLAYTRSEHHRDATDEEVARNLTFEDSDEQEIRRALGLRLPKVTRPSMRCGATGG